MIEHYDAFISYKHAELDSDIAATVQRQLEHFHVPSAISRKIGKRKIGRIFRDKEELPITSSLTETITNALNNSDYLIVICSERTRESIWVDKEIRTFLESHDRTRVLTVLADGEPFNVIPEILLSEEKEIVDEEGNTQIIKESLEPLSCDYRIGKKAANREEIPRLAAAILGCSYDELINRKRQYAMRRSMYVMAAVLTLSFAFGGYMFYSRTRVNEAYQKALENQSRYLASESRSYLQDGRRINALLLAIEALPDEDHRERPVTPEAVRALTDSSLAYVPSNSVDFMEEWNYKMPNNIKQIAFSKGQVNRVYVAALDSAGIVKCWDYLSHEEIFSFGNDGNEILAIVAVDDELFLTISRYSVNAYDIPSRKLKWTFDDDLAYFDGGCYFLDDSYAYFTSELGVINKINLEDGKSPAFYMVMNYDRIPENFMGFYHYSFSPSKNEVAFNMQQMDMTDRNAYDSLCSYNFETDEFKIIKNYGKDVEVGAIEWAKEDSIFVSLEETRKTNGMINGSYTANFPRTVTVLSVNPEDLSNRWTYSFKANMKAMACGFAYYPEPDYIAYYSGNVVGVAYASTGVERGLYDVNDYIVTHVKQLDNAPAYITYNGDYVMLSALESETVLSNESSGGAYLSYKLAPKGTAIAEVMNGIYFVRENENEICSYGINKCDPEFTTVLENISAGKRDDNYYADDNYILDEDYLFIYSDGEGYVYRMSDRNFLGKVDLKGNGRRSSFFHILGRNGEKVYMADLDLDERQILTCVDLQNMTVTDTVLEEKSNFLEPKCTLSGDDLLYIILKNGNYSLYKRNLSSGEESQFVVPGESVNVAAPYAIGETGKVLVSGNDEYIVDMTTGEQIPLDEGSEWLGTQSLCFSKEKSMFAVTDSQSIDVFDDQCNKKIRLETSGSKILFMSFYDDHILAGSEDGYLNMYSIRTGALVKKTEVTLDYYLNKVHNIKFDRDEKNNLLFFHIGQYTNIFDMDSFYEITSINWSIGYHKATDTIWSYSMQGAGHNRSNVGFFKHYSLDELIAKARGNIEGAELSDELKEKYGIY